MEPAFVQVGGIDLVISTIPKSDGTNWTINIAEADLPEISFAQNLRTMIVVHENFKTIKFEFVSINVNAIDIKYAFMELTGNIAETRKVEEKTALKDISFATLKGAIRGLTNGTTYTLASGGVTGKITATGGVIRDIKSVNVTWTNQAIKIEIEDIPKFPTVGISVANNAVTAETLTGASVGNTSVAMQFGTGAERGYDGWWNQFIDNWRVRLTGPIGPLFPAGTAKSVIATTMPNYLTSGTIYSVAHDTDWHTEDDVPNMVLYTNTAATYTITVIDSSDDAYVLNDATDSINGWLKMTAPVISINGYTAGSYDILDRLAPWMDEGLSYQCPPDILYTVNGRTPSSAVKNTVNGQVSITVYTNEAPVDINTDSNVIGFFGINLTPFANAEDGSRPSCVSFHAGRMCISSGNTVYMSKVNEYQNFAYFEDVEFESTQILPSAEWTDQYQEEWVTVTDSVQQTGASSAIKLKLATDEDEIVQWMISAQGLHIGTSTSEWLFPDGLDAVNPRVVLMGRTGSARIRPMFCDNRILFVSSSLRQIFALDPQSPVGSSSMTEHAEDIFNSNIVSMDFRQFPQSEIYVVMANGKALVGRMNANNLYGWSKIETKTGDLILAVTVVFAGDEDAVYFLVNRSGTICMERLHTSVNTDFSTRRYLDSSTYLLSSGNSITGLTRLVAVAGLYLRMMTAGGEVAGSVTVPTGGTLALYTPDGGTTPIALPNFTAFHIGLRYDSTFETQNIDSPETEGLMKTSGAVFVRFLESGRPSIKDPNDLINQIPLNSMPLYPFTGSVRYDASDTARTDKTVRFSSNDDVPVTIQSIKAVITIGDAI